MQSTENSLTKVENGVSTLAAYKAFRTDAMVWADLKVNLVFRNNRAFIHVAGSESEYTDLGAARAYVHRRLRD